jgi:hypothetical protein
LPAKASITKPGGFCAAEGGMSRLKTTFFQSTILQKYPKKILFVIFAITQ